MIRSGDVSVHIIVIVIFGRRQLFRNHQPLELDSIVYIDKLVVDFHGNIDVFLCRVFGDLETVGLGRCSGGEVECCGVINIVFLNSVEFVNDHG